MRKSPKTPDGELFIVVRTPSEARLGVGMQWLRDHMPVVETAFGGMLAALSIYLTVNPPATSERAMWVTVTVVVFVIFVGSVYARSRIDNHEKNVAAERHAAEMRELFGRIDAQMKIGSDSHALLVRFTEEPKGAAAL